MGEDVVTTQRESKEKKNDGYDASVGKTRFWGDEEEIDYVLVELPKTERDLLYYVARVVRCASEVHSQKTPDGQLTEYGVYEVVDELQEQDYFQRIDIVDVDIPDVGGRLRTKFEGDKLKVGFRFSSEDFDVEDLRSLAGLLNKKEEK